MWLASDLTGSSPRQSRQIPGQPWLSASSQMPQDGNLPGSHPPTKQILCSLALGWPYPMCTCPVASHWPREAPEKAAPSYMATNQTGRRPTPPQLERSPWTTTHNSFRLSRQTHTEKQTGRSNLPLTSQASSASWHDPAPISVTKIDSLSAWEPQPPWLLASAVQLPTVFTRV